MNNDTRTLADHYTSKDITVRLATTEELKSLRSGSHVLVLGSFKSQPGMARALQVARAKVNGSPKTWKKDATRVEVPLKYGLYECWRQSADRQEWSQGAIVVEVN